ncbi:PREDICTED: kinesin-like protein Klp61F, partial [Rhagoletis zephyria]|uniref:kinesin-like protein Klp61F n=1 Tax=Rhagoletis zephyria TaxID=28612 RepID=UPI0008115504
HLEAHTCQMSEQIAEIRQISEKSVQQLTNINLEIENERSAAAEERAIMDEIIEKMNALKEKSFTNRQSRADAIAKVTVKLEENTQSTIDKLQQSSTVLQSFCEKSCDGNASTQKGFEQHINVAMECSTQQENVHSSLQEQLCTLQRDSSNRVKEFSATAATHSEHTQKVLDEFEAEVKRNRLESEQRVEDATLAVKQGLAEDSHQLKQHVVVSSGLANSLQQSVLNYADTYKDQMQTCVNDVNNFKQSELKTYAPTGATPSKRNFVYPRSLAATSPHLDIVKRFRQENDWSDLDTTAPIDEASEDEQELRNSAQEISNTEVILNSTPIDLTNVATPQPVNGASKKMNVLLSNQLRNSNSLSTGPSPRKRSPTHNSSAPAIRANKENIS